MAESLHCTLVTPDEQVLSESVTYASIPAHDGLIGLAPDRAALLVRLGDGVLRLDFLEGGSRWFFVGGGFAQMKDNKLSVLANEVVPAEDIVRHDVDKELGELKEAKAPTVEEVEAKTRRVNRAKTMLGMSESLANKL